MQWNSIGNYFYEKIVQNRLALGGVPEIYSRCFKKVYDDHYTDEVKIEEKLFGYAKSQKKITLEFSYTFSL